MDSEKDKKVKRIARFLEMGGTMLAQHCKICGAPKFRYQGTVICPVCDVEEEGETQEPVAEVQVPETRQHARIEGEQEKEQGRKQEREQERKQEREQERKQERLLFEDERTVQARIQEPHFGLKSSEAPAEGERNFGFEEEEPSTVSYESGKPRRYTPEIQAASSEKAEKPVEISRTSGSSGLSGSHGDRKVLENLLFRKMVSIAASLQDETDPRSIAEDLELIDKGLGLVERLRQL
jgi:UPF0148 protein